MYTHYISNCPIRWTCRAVELRQFNVSPWLLHVVLGNCVNSMYQPWLLHVVLGNCVNSMYHHGCHMSCRDTVSIQCITMVATWRAVKLRQFNVSLWLLLVVLWNCVNSMYHHGCYMSCCGTASIQCITMVATCRAVKLRQFNVSTMVATCRAGKLRQFNVSPWLPHVVLWNCVNSMYHHGCYMSCCKTASIQCINHGCYMSCRDTVSIQCITMIATCRAVKLRQFIVSPWLLQIHVVLWNCVNSMYHYGCYKHKA